MSGTASDPVDATRTIHATSVVKDGAAVLLIGTSGVGKSDLALRMIDRGWQLVSDDYTVIRLCGDTAFASAPPRIAGMLEVRGVGIVAMPHCEPCPVRLVCDLEQPVERFPAAREWTGAGLALPCIALAPHEASAPIKLELALARILP